MFDLLDYPIVAHPPPMLTVGPGSAWVGHIPFAMAVVQMLRPARVVELGTHGGDSYCAFCEAVRHLGLAEGTRCTAVDTWAGDAHAGSYGEDVLGRLRAVHDPAYGSFSRLLQSTFDQAVGQFDDGSIDLLHIDGMHTYEAVRHDYQTWLPKLSGRGVVLFHDTAERSRDFGVWQFWDEVRAGRPHATFTHCRGLGVLGVGPDLPAAAVDFFDAAGRNPAGMAAVFARLGNSVELLLLLRNTALPLIHLQAGLDEWLRRTGRSGQVPAAAADAAFGDPPWFAGRLNELVRFALAEDLTVRQL